MSEEIKVEEEAKNEPASEWLEPSAVGDEFMRHEAAMEPVARVPVHKAFAIAPGFNVGMLRKMAEAYKPKRIVVIDHEANGFEVRRLGNNADVSLFYSSIKKILDDSEKVFDLSDFEKFLDEYKNATFEQIERYKAVSEEMKRDAVVSYSYMHKRLTKLACFKKSEEGGTAELKKAIEAAFNAELIAELPPSICKEVYKSSARLFKIL
jgi:hypothetical protein